MFRPHTYGTMRNRSWLITLVASALLLSASANVIAAAFCPRFASHRDCCLVQIPLSKQIVNQASCHHETTGMKMTGMAGDGEMKSSSEPAAKPSEGSQPNPARDAFSDEGALDLPIQACTHCVTHSQPASGTADVISVDPSKRLLENGAPPVVLRAPTAAAFSIAITPSEHGPPGQSLPRHVLINIFRI